MENNVQQEEDNKRKKWLLLLLLLLLFLLVMITTIIFVRDNGEAVATSKDETYGKTNDEKVGIYEPKEGETSQAEENANVDFEEQKDLETENRKYTRTIYVSTAVATNQNSANPTGGGH